MRKLALLSALLLAACDMRPGHAEWQQQCASSHTEMYPIVTPGPNGSMQTTWMYVEDCDRYEPVCVPGKDGSTACGAKS